ncbi:MAG TPA: BON domain-containing protein [Gemmataceae bacterium]|nr:BON domain-containing protein [Gemmataceae bacterium]
MRSRSNKKNGRACLLWWLRAGVKPLIALALFAGTLLFCALPSSVATNPPAWQPLPAQPVDPAIQDMELTLRARRALADDPVIAKLDLGVEVRNRVATLWGSVSSKELCQQAEARLRNGLGLTAVCNELHIDAADAPGGPLPPLQVRSPLAEPMIRESPPQRQTVAQRPSDIAAVMSQEVLWHAATARTITKAPLEDSHGTAAPALPAVKPAGASKPPMPLVSLPGYPVRDVMPTPAAPALAPAAEKSVDLATAVESFRTRDARYQGIKPEIRGHVVVLRGTVLRWDHLYDLARSVSTIRGVERVVLDNVRADSTD